jgi:hypothetical protein
LPDEELTEVDDDLAVGEDVELDAAGVEVEVEVDALADDELEVDVEGLALDAEVDDDKVPGIVCALTMPSSATPATAVNAAPAVSRLSKTMAALRARIRPAVVRVLSMTVSFGPSPQPIM